MTLVAKKNWDKLNFWLKIVLWCIPMCLAIALPLYKSHLLVNTLKGYVMTMQGEIDDLNKELNDVKTNYMTMHFGLRDFDIVKSDGDTVNSKLYTLIKDYAILDGRVAKCEGSITIIINQLDNINDLCIIGCKGYGR